MNMVDSCRAILSIVYYKAQDPNRIFIAIKIHESEINSHKTMEFHPRPPEWFHGQLHNKVSNSCNLRLVIK